MIDDTQGFDTGIANDTGYPSPAGETGGYDVAQSQYDGAQYNNGVPQADDPYRLDDLVSDGSQYNGQEEVYDYYLQDVLASEFHNTPAGMKYQTVDDLAKAYNHAESLIHKKVENFKEKDWEAYATINEVKFGIPKEYTGYDFSDVALDDGVFDVIGESDDKLDAFAQVMHKCGVSRDAAKQLYAEFNHYENAIEGYKQQQKSAISGKNLAAIKNEWGKAFGAKKSAVENALNNIMPKLGIGTASEIKEAFREFIETSNPVILRTLTALGELGQSSPNAGYGNVMSPVDAKTMTEQMLADPNTRDALTNPYHKDHKRLSLEFQRLHKIQAGEM